MAQRSVSGYRTTAVTCTPCSCMDHCNDLGRAGGGPVAHLACAWVEEPFLVGGEPDNAPE